MPLDPYSLKSEFPILSQSVHGYSLVYLDNAATHQCPKSVLETVFQFEQQDRANVHRGIHELAHRSTARFEAAREAVARFIGAPQANEIVFTRGTTESINLVAQTWGRSHLQPGDEILLTVAEHHGNLIPWQHLARETGALLRFMALRPNSSELDWDSTSSLFNARTRLLACSHVSNVLGSIHPVERLCELARTRGVVTLIDAAQSIGHLPIDVRELNCDFLAFSAHKAYGPTGIGVLYGKAERLSAMPPWQMGGEMIETVHLESSTYAPPPHRFEAGTPNISGVIGLHAALEFMERIGRTRIRATEQQLTDYALEQLQRLPFVKGLGPRLSSSRAGIFAFNVSGVHSHDVITLANDRGVALRGGHHCAQPLLHALGLDSAIRASWAAYNTREDIDRLVDALKEAKALFAP